MRFPNYLSAVAYLTAYSGDNVYTIIEVCPEEVGQPNDDCIEAISPEDKAWVIDAFETGEFYDQTFELGSGDASLGYILCFWNQAGDVVRVFAYSPYY